MKQLGYDVDAMRKERMKQYGDAGDALTVERANQELVAKFIEENLLTDEGSIYALVRRDPTLGQKIKNWLDKVLAKLGDKNAQERAFIRNARDLYAKALKETNKQDKQVSKTEATRSRLQEDLAAGRITEEEYDETMDAMAEDEAMEDGSMLYQKGKDDRGEVEQHSIARTKHMTWQEQVNGALYGAKNIKRNDTLVVCNLNDTILANLIEDKPMAIPLSVMTKAQNGKDISHSIKPGKLARLDVGIKEAPITVVNPDRNAIVFITNIKQGGLPLVATFEMNTEFDKDRVHKATSIYLQVDVMKMLKILPNNATIYVQKKR